MEKDLLADLALHNFDLVISNGLPKPGLSVKTYNHFPGECGITFFAEKHLAKRLPEKFPDCLDNAPMVIPMTMSWLRGAIDQWSESLSIRPVVGHHRHRLPFFVGCFSIFSNEQTRSSLKRHGFGHNF